MLIYLSETLRKVRKLTHILNVGFIGCGGIARFHLRHLSTLKEVKLVAFCDKIKEKAKELAEKYGGNVYTDYHEMFHKEKMDVVFICLPPFAHSDEVMVAAENGVHIYIEKPIALDLKLAREMQKAVEKAGIKSQVGYQLRFSYSVEKAKELIDSGEAGNVGLACGHYWCRFIRKDWWIDKSKSGGQIVEQSTHLYDILRWLCGEIERVYCEGGRLFYKNVPRMTIEDTSSVVLRFKSGAIGSVTATIGAAKRHWWMRWWIVCSNLLLESLDFNELRIYRSNVEPVRVESIKEFREEPILLAEKDLIEAIIYDRPTRTPIKEGVKTLEVTLAAVKSMETGEVVTLPL